MSIELAEITKQSYLRGGGGNCLFCHSTDMAGDKLKADGSWMSNDIECNNCGATWTDVFNLGDVTDIKLPTKEFKLAGGKFCDSCGDSWAVHNDDGSCVEPMWREIDFGDDIEKQNAHDKDRFNRSSAVLSKVQFETLCGPLNEIPNTKGWRVEHVNPGPTTIETWTVEVGDVEVRGVSLNNRCVIVLGDKK